MGELNNLFVSSSYQGLLKLTDSTNGLTNTLQTVQSGNGVNGPLQMSRTAVNISGSFSINNIAVTGTTSGTSGSSGTSGANGSNGSSGTSGTSGTGFAILGDWDNVTNYVVGNVVYYNGNSYVAIQDNINKLPQTYPNYWQLFSASGSNGTSGTSGTSGGTGSSGTSGTSGTSFTWKGVFNSFTGYSVNDVVSSNGSSYVCILAYPPQSFPYPIQPGFSPTYWSLMAQAGTNGTSGTSGAAGSSGTSGTSFQSPYTGDIIVTGSINVTGQYLVNGVPVTGSGGGGDRNGLITTGSVSTSKQSITGSLLISGSNSIADGGTLAISGSQIWRSRNSSTGESTVGNFNGGQLEISATGIVSELRIYGNQDNMITLNSFGTNRTSLIRYFKSIAGVAQGTYFGTNDYGSGNSNYLYVSASNSTGVGNYMGFGSDRNKYNLGNYVFSNADNSATTVYVSGSVNIAGQYLVNGVPLATGSAGDRNGLITTGSASSTQQITGSLILDNTIISGALVSNTVNGGLLNFTSEARLSGSVKLNISSSAPVSQSNFLINGGGPPAANLTGSIVISGSNNIMFNPFRQDTLATAGRYGYVGGNNIVFTIPTLNTASLVSPSMLNNQLNSALSISFITSSVLAVPSISNNQILGATTINHLSGSVNLLANIIMGSTLNSTANTTPLGLNTTIAQNIVAGFNPISLNHVSSSITYNGNIGGGMTVTNNYSSSFSTGVNNINVVGNLFNGSNNTLTVTGSNSGTRRTFDSNTILGRNNEINSNYDAGTGSFTAGHLVATNLLGQGLIVSASNTSTTFGGTTIVGRYNATGSLQESSQDTIFVVGTGFGNASRRNALRIDSNNNTQITGSVTISGSLQVNGVSPLIGTTGLITTGSYNTLQNISSSLLVANTQTAGHPYLLQAQAFGLGQNAASFTGVTNITGSLIVNGATITASDRNGLITTGSVGGSQSMSSSLLVANTSFAGHNYLLQAQAFTLSDNALSVTGRTNITGSLFLNGVAVTSTDRNGLITTGSYGSSNQTIAGTLKISGSASEPFQIQAGDSTARIDILNGGPALYRNSNTYNTILGNVKGIQDGFETGSEKNMLFTGFFLGFTSGSNNTVISGNGGANFRSGSNNTIIGNVGSLEFGNNNTYIGTGGPSTLEDNTIRIGRTGLELLVKSGSNATQIQGDVQITGSLLVNTLSDATGSFVVTTDSTGTLTKSPYSAVTSNLFSVGDFYSTQTQTLAGGVSGSVTYNNAGTTYGVSLVSGSQLTIAKAGVYNIQFSAQILSDSGADDVWFWLKKNGTNIDASAGRVTLANNDELMAAWNYLVSANAGDYFELVWQNLNGHAELLYNAPSGNIPSVPSIIITVTQVR